MTSKRAAHGHRKGSVPGMGAIIRLDLWKCLLMKCILRVISTPASRDPGPDSLSGLCSGMVPESGLMNHWDRATKKKKKKGEFWKSHAAHQEAGMQLKCSMYSCHIHDRCVLVKGIIMFKEKRKKRKGHYLQEARSVVDRDLKKSQW